MMPRRKLVSITPEAAQLDGLVVPRSSIECGYYSPPAGKVPACVRLIGKSERTIANVEVASREEAEALLDRLELGAAQRTAWFHALMPKESASRRIGRAGVVAGLVLLLGGAASLTVWLAVIGLSLAITGYCGFRTCKVQVGADGLVLVSDLFPARYIPWSDVVGVDLAETGILVRRRGGTIEIPLSTGGDMSQEFAQAEQHAFLGRAIAALEAYRLRTVPAAVAQLGRHDRPIAEWLRQLRASGGSFRSAPLIDEELWSVVESSAAEVTARAAAAAVLARSAGEPERQRLRDAAEACAEPNLRTVLDRAANAATEEELERALSALAKGDAEGMVI